MWENRRKYDQRWSPNTWIYRIASNLAIDHLRSRRSRERSTEPIRQHLRQVSGGQSESDLAELHRAEVMTIFRELAAGLTDKQRLVFLLREVEGLSSQEVADVAGCRESTVRNHLFNARKVLRRELLRRYPEYAPAEASGRRRMSCPDWGRLAAHRLDPQLAEPAGWEESLAHLDGCADCRRRALAADPTLVFRRLAGAGEAAAATAGADAEAMREAVAAMRRASRLLPAGSRRPLPATVRRLAGTAGRGWTRAAAAVLFIAGLLALGPTAPPATAGDPVAAVDLAAAPVSTAPAAGVALVGTADALARQPVFEGLDRPRDAHVYQLDGDGLVVVMIVDETLDV